MCTSHVRPDERNPFSESQPRILNITTFQLIHNSNNCLLRAVLADAGADDSGGLRHRDRRAADGRSRAGGRGLREAAQSPGLA